MREGLSILTVDPRDERGMAAVVKFGESFNHTVKAPHAPVHVLRRGEKWIGFFQRMPMIVCAPSWHSDPEICGPRDVYEGGQLLREVARFADGTCVVETDPVGAFTPEIMEKLGFAPRNSLLYQAQ